MKKEFTKEYIIKNRGCYGLSEVKKLPFINNEPITIVDIFNNIPISDFVWFLSFNCELNAEQKFNISIALIKKLQKQIIKERTYTFSRFIDCDEIIQMLRFGMDTSTQHFHESLKQVSKLYFKSKDLSIEDWFYDALQNLLKALLYRTKSIFYNDCLQAVSRSFARNQETRFSFLNTILDTTSNP